MIALAAGNVCTAQTAGASCLDALSTALHSTADALLHSAAESDAALQLTGNVLSNQLSIGVNVVNLNDVHVHALADHLAQLLLQVCDLSAALADNHAGLCAVNVYLDLGLTGLIVGGALDLDFRNTSAEELLFQSLTDLVVLYQGVAELLLGSKPAAVPIFNHTHADAMGIDFLAH